VPEVVAAAGTAMEPQVDLPGIQADEPAPATPCEASVAQADTRAALRAKATRYNLMTFLSDIVGSILRGPGVKVVKPLLWVQDLYTPFNWLRM